MRHAHVIIGLACVFVVAAASARISSQPRVLTVERRGDVLHLSAPQFHFLEGTPLERLHQGSTVTYILSVAMSTDQAAVGAARQTVGGGREPSRESPGTWSRRAEDRFIFSYDLWEEKFAVVQANAPRRSASHLTTAMAEAWCLDDLLPRVPQVPPEHVFIVKLDCAVADDDPQPGEGLTLSALLDVLSRKRAAAPPHWEILSGPLRLVDLKDGTRR